MDWEPSRITALRALVAARLAMVPVLTVLPPVMVLTILVLTERATEDAALLAARWMVFFRRSASFSASRRAAASSFCRCFSAAAASFWRYFSAAASSFSRWRSAWASSFWRCFSAAAASASCCRRSASSSVARTRIS